MDGWGVPGGRAALGSGLVGRRTDRRGDDGVGKVLGDARSAVTRMHAANRAMEEALVRADLRAFFRALRSFDAAQRRYDEAARRWDDLAQRDQVGAPGLPAAPVRCEPVRLPASRWRRLRRGTTLRDAG